MKEHAFTRLTNWFQLNCNGDWEHDCGIRLETIDNPGWRLNIAIEDTAIRPGVEFTKKYQNENDEHDWYSVQVKESNFEIVCGVQNLIQAIEIFFEEFVCNHLDPEFHYEILLPAKNFLDGCEVFLSAKATFEDESTLVIKSIGTAQFENVTFRDLSDIQKLDESEMQLRASKVVTDFHVGERVGTKIVDHSNGTGILAVKLG